MTAEGNAAAIQAVLYSPTRAPPERRAIIISSNDLLNATIGERFEWCESFG
jgi:hypothetical protein